VAQTVAIPGSNDAAKIREPVAVWLLNIPTLGLYAWFWWYYINDELRHLGQTRSTTELGTSPGVSLLAYGLGGWLVIPLVWTIITTTRRIQRAQRMCGVEQMSGWIAAAHWIFTFGIGGVIYTQSSLNKVWRSISRSDSVAQTPQVGPAAARTDQIDHSQARFCTSCGSALRPDSQFCGSCGAAVTLE
jgi:hypothetical protein